MINRYQLAAALLLALALPVQGQSVGAGEDGARAPLRAEPEPVQRLTEVTIIEPGIIALTALGALMVVVMRTKHRR